MPAPRGAGKLSVVVLTPIAALSGAVDGGADTAPLTPLHPGLHGADLAVDLDGRRPESTRLLLATRPRRLIGFAHPALPATSPPRGLLELTIADVMAAAREVRTLRTGGGFNHGRPGSAKQHGRTPA
jgi:hypothetical protein